MYTNGGLKRTHSHPFSRTFTALSLFIFLIIRKLITPSFTYIQLSCSAFLRYDYVRTISFLSLAQSQTRGTASDTGLPLAVSPRGKLRKFRRVCIVFFFFFYNPVSHSALFWHSRRCASSTSAPASRSRALVGLSLDRERGASQVGSIRSIV